MNNSFQQKQRIAKVIARSGVASRRESERLILGGKVAVNGNIINGPALNVSENDLITINGEPIPDNSPSRLWLYHKSKGLVTSTKDEKSRPTVFDHLPAELPRLMSVGRLDINSEGLLLLTNDGEIKRWFELPSNRLLRCYRVRAYGKPNSKLLVQLRTGITINREPVGPMEIKVDSRTGSNVWFTVSLRQGRNREVRRAMESINMNVNRLIRTSYGPFRLGQLKTNEIKEVKGRFLKRLVETRLK